MRKIRASTHILISMPEVAIFCGLLYHNGELLFEGNYLKGKKNGKGKEYYYNGELVFEIEYLNGKIKDRRKAFGKDDYLIFDKEYLYEKKYRRELDYKFYKIKFEGDYLNWEKNNLW